MADRLDRLERDVAGLLERVDRAHELLAHFGQAAASTDEVNALDAALSARLGQAETRSRVQFDVQRVGIEALAARVAAVEMGLAFAFAHGRRRG